MLRLHFTAADLARTRVADGPDLLWETVLSLHRLRDQRLDPQLTGWSAQVRRQALDSLPLLLPLVPQRGYFPDFLTPPEGALGLEYGLDALLSTPQRQLRGQLELLYRSVHPTPWTRELADGKAAALRRLGDALRAYQRTAVGAWWQPIRGRVEADRTQRARTQWTRGTEALLSSLGPTIRWRAPVLEADYPVDRDLRLEGRGLLLIPSYFCHLRPIALADPELPPTLVYPARAPGPQPPAVAEATAPRLAPLLGHTRAAVLQALGSNCTTSELARRAGVSVSSASEHAAVLRRAGLISSSRERNAVHHALTPMGLALLEG
ncbi:ArsR/SmtB family transcription factor [Streptomyces boncukensis]|uniref:Winged helix-turn-helix transcriptional regulator n=1 Tax=Streptomyces boncukensis TaxID=2711219 RepID=A0A6G4X4J9_9ACTN|nr:winged helix-turn-helix domain-containing protein [Streptomyces boncukensis]NGO72456.1 winged helix-turn-helix transcriptional regulator [Streptomyces boncukensis]